MYRETLDQKLEEIREELRRLDLWQRPPGWVYCYPEERAMDFLTWLQFVYLPNRSLYRQPGTTADLAPQAAPACEKLPGDSCLLQLIVELDALI